MVLGHDSYGAQYHENNVTAIDEASWMERKKEGKRGERE
jgi:hypothetical protein